MAAQTIYTRLTDRALHATPEWLVPREVVSYAAEAVAGLAYGVAVQLGTDPDKQVLVGGTAPLAFGISLRENTREGAINTGDMLYAQDDTVSVMRKGDINLNCAAGCVPGQIVVYDDTTGVLDAGTITGAAVAGGGNTGDGVAGAVTVGSDAKVGTYTLTCVTAQVDAGIFSVVDPDGNRLDDLTVAVAYSNNHFSITIADGATDFIVGDTFTIPMTVGAGVSVLAGAKWQTTTAAAGIGIARLDGTKNLT